MFWGESMAVGFAEVLHDCQCAGSYEGALRNALLSGRVPLGNCVARLFKLVMVHGKTVLIAGG